MLLVHFRYFGPHATYAIEATNELSRRKFAHEARREPGQVGGSFENREQATRRTRKEESRSEAKRGEDQLMFSRKWDKLRVGVGGQRTSPNEPRKRKKVAVVDCVVVAVVAIVDCIGFILESF